MIENHPYRDGPSTKDSKNIIGKLPKGTTVAEVSKAING